MYQEYAPQPSHKKGEKPLGSTIDQPKRSHSFQISWKSVVTTIFASSIQPFHNRDRKLPGYDGHIVDNQIVAIDSKTTHQEDEEIERQDGIEERYQQGTSWTSWDYDDESKGGGCVHQRFINLP